MGKYRYSLKARIHIFCKVIWRGWWRLLIALYGLVSIYSVCRTEVFPKANLPSVFNLIPQWHWAIWGTIGLGILLIALFEGAYRLLFPLVYDNWIEKHRIQHGKYPPLPKYLQQLVNNYHSGAISKDIQPVTPSAQYWNRLLSSQQKEWEELVRWLGENPQDYIDHMKMMLPNPPKGTKWEPFEQH